MRVSARLDDARTAKPASCSRHCASVPARSSNGRWICCTRSSAKARAPRRRRCCPATSWAARTVRKNCRAATSGISRRRWKTSMVLAGTGYWLALDNARDRWHERAVAVGRRLTEPLVVTWPVVAEICHLMFSPRRGSRADREEHGTPRTRQGASRHHPSAHGEVMLICLWTWPTLRWSQPPRNSAMVASSPPTSATSTTTDGRTLSLSAIYLNPDGR